MMLPKEVQRIMPVDGKHMNSRVSQVQHFFLSKRALWTWQRYTYFVRISVEWGANFTDRTGSLWDDSVANLERIWGRVQYSCFPVPCNFSILFLNFLVWFSLLLTISTFLKLAKGIYFVEIFTWLLLRNCWGDCLWLCLWAFSWLLIYVGWYTAPTLGKWSELYK